LTIYISTKTQLQSRVICIAPPSSLAQVASNTSLLRAYREQRVVVYASAQKAAQESIMADQQPSITSILAALGMNAPPIYYERRLILY
jgi:hypothetical protein